MEVSGQLHAPAAIIIIIIIISSSSSSSSIVRVFPTTISYSVLMLPMSYMTRISHFYLITPNNTAWRRQIMKHPIKQFQAR
jgi:hypothetical protein